jgi:hypothetical protein
MRRGGAGLVIALFALVGCKGLTSKPVEKKDKDNAAAVSRPKGSGPAWLEGSLAKIPRTPGPDAAGDGTGLLAGRVLDPSGRGAKNVYIRIEPVDALPREKDGAALGILTDDAGYFLVKAVPPGRVYVLTAETKTAGEGKPLFGQVQTRPPQPNITIALRDDLALPSPGSSAGLPPAASATGLPPASDDRIPPMGLPAPGHSGHAGDGGWAPGAGSATGSIPATIPGSTPIPAPVGVPPPRGDYSPADPQRTVRPESTATGESTPWRPPAANIPNGPPVPSLPLPPPGPVLPEKNPPRPVRAADNFTLVDSLERPWDFAANRSGSLVLLEFMTTNCVWCNKSIGILANLQSRYASQGLQLIGVLCDDLPRHDRAALAAKYQRDHGLNFAVYVEPGPAGSVRDHFNVEAYPTVVLLNAEGTVVWRGHPGDSVKLEAAIRRQLER